MSEQNVMEASPSGGEDFEGGAASSFEFEGADGSEGEESGGAPGAPGAGQSKSSRRRRRKRRNKLAGDSGPAPSQEAATVPPGTIVMEGESLAMAASALPVTNGQQARRPSPQGFAPGAQGSQPQGSQQGSQQQGFQQGQGAQGPGKRWKKKFRDRERRPGRSENPGNDFRAEPSGGAQNGNGFSSYAENGYSRGARPDNFGNRDGAFKRKAKAGGSKDRGFVGPMDHSYREGNGFGDAPPSTIQVHGGHGPRRGHRHQGDSQPLDFSGPRPIPIPENAQIHIYLFIEDLFLTAKIQETARKQGIKIAFVKNEKDVISELTSGEDVNKPALIVFDLNNANAKPLTLIPKLKAKLKRSVSIVGFLSHLQGDLKAKAVEAGCDVVVPRAAFSQNLPNLLRRYGAEEGEEVNFNY